MSVKTAREYLGQRCKVYFEDGYGEDIVLNMKIWNVTSAPMYGSFLLGDAYNVNLEMVRSIEMN